jgi:alpha-N-acetylglucosaminidase
VIAADADGLDVFEIGNDGNKISISGSSGTAIAYGLQWYLKTTVHTQTDWDNHKLQLPPVLPKVETTLRQKRSAKYTYYQNVCTVSYSSWAWSWEQWERHIDWMALNGINIPLAFTGQEKVWQQVFKTHYNISDAGLGKFFAGAAFLAWGRMGNLRGSWVKGPLPQAFIDDQFALQLQILDRYKTYGMVAALPAFAGHIPEELHVKHPNAKWTRSPNWGNFTDEFCCVYMLDAKDPLYLDIGTKFIQEQTRMYNYTSSLYQCDTYNEMDPDTTDTTELATAAKSVIDSMLAADPKAVWLMQGWLFMSDYWTKELTRAYLSGVSNDHMIILDLYSEVSPIWAKMDNYFGKSWIYCVLHNFGGNTGMRGDLPTLGQDPVVSNQASQGTMIGVGLTMEGIFQNYVVYDLTLQMAWQSTPVNTIEWVNDYVYRRYHTPNDHAQQAWRVLHRSVYNRTKAYGGVTKNLATVFPHWQLDRDGFMPTVITYDPEDVVRAWKLLLAASDALGEIDTFRHDVVDVTRQFLSDRMLKLYQTLKQAYNGKTVSPETLCALNTKLLRVIQHLDEILGTNEDFLLGSWIRDARAMGHGNAELETYYEYEARNQVTRWGDHNDNVLHDYACKEWSGLMKGYYLGRWRIWLTEVCHAYTEKREMNASVLKNAREGYELKWQLGREPYPTTPRGDTIAISKRLYSEYIDSAAITTGGGLLWDVDGRLTVADDAAAESM